MHDQESIARVLALAAKGINDCAISRETGLPRSTVQMWRSGSVPKRARQTCDVCAGRFPQLPEPEYAYALGLYLGDGCISRCPRTFRLRIFLDASYRQIIRECASALHAIRPDNAVRIDTQGKGTAEVGVSWNHWPCVFPQHGPGRKHLRRIWLASWQEAIVATNRESLIRGLLHSDGCRVVANDRGVASVRYHFANLSEDIKRIYCESLDALGIPWTRPSYKDIAVYRKTGTAALDEFVGPKA